MVDVVVGSVGDDVGVSGGCEVACGVVEVVVLGGFGEGDSGADGVGRGGGIET